MFVLYESPAGFSLFKIKDESKINDENLEAEVEANPEKILKLVAFDKFRDAADAIRAATALVQSELDKPLAKFLKANLSKKDKLLVADSKLGAEIKKKLEIDCVAATDKKLDVLRAIRESLYKLIPGLEEKDVIQMSLASAHNLSRYKLRFSPDKVDTMIVQAIALLDELDKEINTYSMRVREWYGWHFPEMAKVVTDGLQYAKVVTRSRARNNMRTVDFSDILEDEEVEKRLKETAEVSMGTDVSEDDLNRICELADQVVALSTYRAQLSEYLKNRMNAIAPNLTVMLGELVGARLIAHAGSLLNLAKAPASTVQILGAEKALFRALKTKHDTPKYGLIYHASLIGQAAPKNKGKIARVLASKASLAIRVDALGENAETDISVALECRQKVEARLRQLETGEPYQKPASSSAAKPSASKSRSTAAYNEASDVVSSKKKSKKDEDENGEEDEQPKKRVKMDDDEEENGNASSSKKEKKSKKKTKEEDLVEMDDEDEEDRKRKKKEKKEKKRSKQDDDE
jgi:nucleolar protein 58